MPDLEQWPTGRLLTTAARLVEHAWNERLVNIGVTHAGVIALGVMASQGAMTQAHLAQIVRVQAQTMGKTLSRLETRGHISRARNDLDRRSHMVSITTAGTNVLEQAQNLERTLVTDEALISSELREHLQSVIRELGAPRRAGTGNSPKTVSSEADLPDALLAEVEQAEATGTTDRGH